MANRPAERARAKVAIEKALSRLTCPEDKVSVLEDALYVVGQTQRKPSTKRSRTGFVDSAAAAQSAIAEMIDPLWKRIEAYCLNHNPEGTYDYTAVGKILLPGLPPEKARSQVYSAVFRRSAKSDRPCDDPRFEVLGIGFRLLRRGPEGVAQQGP